MKLLMFMNEFYDALAKDVKRTALRRGEDEALKALAEIAEERQKYVR